ncbi:MAG TPA: phenylalanine 4-monooxygenase [Microscillaceae bacterium]|nr:phenylalanine 4-monooxygenase [Microscillaceae bacterium]
MEQIYSNYTDEDFKVWELLYHRQMKILPGMASKDYLEGIKIIQFDEKIPKFEDMNKILKVETDWRVYVVPGLIPDKEFFELMQNRNFCASTWLRKMKELDYLQEPDMFHDVFGHVPLLTNKAFCKFLEELCRIASDYIDNKNVIEAIARIYWFTVEFGLIKEEEGLRIYGAGILSSSGECEYSLFSNEPKRFPYDVQHVMDTDYIKHKYQEEYFIIDSYEQLYNSIPEIEAKAKEIHEKGIIVKPAVQPQFK